MILQFNPPNANVFTGTEISKYCVCKCLYLVTVLDHQQSQVWLHDTSVVVNISLVGNFLQHYVGHISSKMTDNMLRNLAIII